MPLPQNQTLLSAPQMGASQAYFEQKLPKIGSYLPRIGSIRMRREQKLLTKLPDNTLIGASVYSVEELQAEPVRPVFYFGQTERAARFDGTIA